MGFCEMVYHETAKFPQSEKEGLAKELRSSSMLLLRTITRDSVKDQKEFLGALDKTIDIQLDVLILLKLAFRMGFMVQRVYQTMEEDLKGMESIANEMKSMQGIKISDESIFTQMSKDKKQEKRPQRKPAKKPPLPAKKEKPRYEKPRTGNPQSKRGAPPKPKSKSLAPIEKTDRRRESANPVNPGDFAGTPLYDDDDPAVIQPEKVIDATSKTEDQKPAGADKTPKRKSTRSRWSLKRSVSKRPSRPKSGNKE